jgi:2-iminobutanoate/2-iminopropanoate deaminase
MIKEIFHVPGLSDALKKANVPLSAVVRGGGLVFVSGIPPLDPKTGKLITADIAAQTDMCLQNVKLCLEAAGSSLDKVLKCTVLITNSAHFETVNGVYRGYFDHDAPARTFCTVGSWPWPFDIEVECIALA